jgi:hypothetical protein
MIRAAAGLLAALLLWTAPAAAAVPRADVTVTRNGQSWTADYRFTGRAGAWMFTRSEKTREGGQDWRTQSWRVETPGVRLERHGRHDALVGVDGRPVPARVRISFTPAAVDLDAGYDPALIFTDGSVALYTKQFALRPQPGATVIDALPLDLNGVTLPDAEVRITFRDAAGPVLLAGRRLAVARVLDDDDGDGTYIVFGRLQPIVTAAMTAVIDPQLPAWIRASLDRGVPDILGRYATVLGPAPGPKPTILVSWAGPTPGRISLGGSVLAGMVTLAYEGDRLNTESQQARFYGLWFIAHEAAHFWLGQAVHYEYARESWITEGGAELLAFRTVAAVDPTYDWRGAVNAAIAECLPYATGKGVAGAAERGESRAYYSCGAVFGLVAEGASHRPFIQFVRRLIDENRADATVTRAEWLAALDAVSGDPTLSRDIGVLLDSGSPDPKAAIASLLRRAGIPFTTGADGVPRVT